MISSLGSTTHAAISSNIMWWGGVQNICKVCLDSIIEIKCVQIIESERVKL
jgi:hypothetical protein